MQELKEQRIWVCWKRVNGRKKPYSPITGRSTGTSQAHRSEWASFEETDAAKGNYNGIGFVLPEGCFLLDMDHTDTASVSLPTYLERSPSGNGFHYYGTVDLGALPVTDGRLSGEYLTKNSAAGLELYIGGLTNRFATYTGDAVNDLSVSDCTEEVLAFLDRHMRRKNRTINRENPKQEGADTGEILSSLRRAKNGKKFISLYDDGEIPEGKTQSEADLSLCAMIAFRTGPNPALIDEIFRGSKLYRPKWDRDDYSRMTISQGIEACHGVFHHSVRPAPEFIFTDTKGRTHVSSTRLAAYVRANLDYILVQEAERGRYQKYVYCDGCYRVYSDDQFRGAIKKFVEAHDPNLVRMSEIEETFRILNTDEDYVPWTALDADEGIINFQNGLLHLDTMELTPHSPDVLSTIQISCEWGSPAPTPLFDSYIHRLTGGNTELERLLLQFMGVAISNVRGYRMKKALFMYGPGDTGKSQLKRLTEMILGEANCSAIDLDRLEEKFGASSIYGKRLAGSADMSFMTVKELKVFKRVTGGDTIQIEFKGEKAFDAVYNGVLWFCMNDLPKFGGDDGDWVYERIMPVQCAQVIPKEEQDPRLLEKMYAERQGIIWKAVEALRQVIANGYSFTEPTQVTKARAGYKVENNSALEFFSRCMVRRYGPISGNDVCTVSHIYDEYWRWYSQIYGDRYRKSWKDFYRDIAAHLGTTFADMKTPRRGNGVYLREWTINPQALEEFKAF